MNRPAKLQVTTQANFQPFYRSQMLMDGVEIIEGLGGMLVTIIATVDHWYIRIVSHHFSCAGQRMSHHNYVCIFRYNPGGISYDFTFRRGGGFAPPQ